MKVDCSHNKSRFGRPSSRSCTQCVRPCANLRRDNLENCTHTGHVLETDLPCSELGREMNDRDKDSRHAGASRMSTVVYPEINLISNVTLLLIWLWSSS